MPAEFLDLLTFIGTLVMIAVAGLVVIMVLVSFIERFPSRNDRDNERRNPDRDG